MVCLVIIVLTSPNLLWNLLMGGKKLLAISCSEKMSTTCSASTRGPEVGAAIIQYLDSRDADEFTSVPPADRWQPMFCLKI
jgi:hypothetical protein